MDVVLRCVRQLLGAGTPSMLSLGFRVSGRGVNNGMRSLPSLENHFPNTLVSQVQRADWRALLQRVGACKLVVVCPLCMRWASELTYDAARTRGCKQRGN
jgi:hypothetical protein